MHDAPVLPPRAKAEGVPYVDLGAGWAAERAATIADLDAVFASGAFIGGEAVELLEERLARLCGTRYAVTLDSGTDALMLALKAHGIGPGDEVITPPNSFIASTAAIVHVGATPVFVDVLPDSFNLDPASLKAGIETAKRHKLHPTAVIPVDLYGQPADYPGIEAIAKAEGLWILSDAAQSFGAALGGRKVGTMGLITTTSFFPSKPLGCYGDGGAVFTDDLRVAGLIDSLRVHGKGSDKYDNVRIGANCRLDTIQAAVLLAKLEIFRDEIAARNRIAERYNTLLQDMVQVPRLDPGATSVWAQYTVVVENRDAVAAKLKDQGIPTMVYYPMPLHRQTAYKHYPVAANGLPVAERLSASVLSLPMHPYLDEATQDRIVAALRAAA